ncbi:NAD-dependent epimerase/dehydratase family protein [Paenibacillus sp. GCM10027628]|uniref:NAD-dependent epimerase/dehydratase family protein n=1 Tax=Paenibacillus sp. GCM10027628 TaxID=3273413 RepID=UPI00363AAC03
MILITGGLGFIGIHTARALLDLGETCVLTQYRTSEIPNFVELEIGKRVFIEQVDITNSSAFLEIGKRHKISGIVHLAMPGSGVTGLFDKLRAHNEGLQNVLQAAHQWGVPRVGIGSAIGVYMGVSESPFREDMPLPMSADNPFTTFKKSSELIASYAARSADFEVVNLRIAGIWGPMQKSAANLVVAPKLVHAAVRGVPTNFSDPASSHLLDAYDMCYVKDCARGIALLQTAQRLNHSTYNIGSGRVIMNEEFFAAIKRMIPDAEIALPKGHCLDVCLDITRIRQDTGYEPEYDVERGIADYIGWLKSGNKV